MIASKPLAKCGKGKAGGGVFSFFWACTVLFLPALKLFVLSFLSV